MPINPNYTNSQSLSARRRLLKVIGVSGSVAATLPDKWSRPMVDAALLPAHAQTSGCNIMCNTPGAFFVGMSWNAGVSVDIDLIIETPGGSIVGPKSGQVRVGQCVQHEGDDGATNNGSEQVVNSTDFVGQIGTFNVILRNNSGAPACVSIGASVCGSGPNTAGGIGSNTSILVGTIAISSGGSSTFNLSLPASCPG